MALTHAKPGDVVAVLPPSSSDPQPRAAAIFKAKDLEVLRLVMKKGDHLPPHRVRGEITVQCVSGALELGVGDGKRTLRAGEMSYLSGGMVHDVRAIDDCVALVTIALLG